MDEQKPQVQNNSIQKISPPFSLRETCSDDDFDGVMLNVCNLLRDRKNIVVVAGAGISTSTGIPDFRSKGGVYETLKNSIDFAEFGLSTPEELFHIEVFQENPKLFYSFIRSSSLFTSNPECTPSHRWLAMLEEKKMLRRIYTQNIDGLEVKAGVSPKKVVYAHGSLSSSTCCSCGLKVDTDSIRDEVMTGHIPRCKAMLLKKRKKGNETPHMCNGILKPDITFFGEKLCDKVGRCLESDRTKADALIVIGTSLSVSPMNTVIKFLKPNIPRILINRNIVVPKNINHENNGSSDEDEVDHRNGYIFDAVLLGFCDEITRAFAFIMQNKCSNMKKVGSNLIATKDLKFLTKHNRTAKLFPFHSDDCKLLSQAHEILESLNEKYLLRHPIERIILFPGAKFDSAVEDDDVSYVEVVNCNGCHKEIDGQIMTCSVCFDYDLCKKCHRTLKRSHFDGTHKFHLEK